MLVVDGMSSDGTRDIVKQYEKKYEFIRLVDNKRKITPSAFNVGIQCSRGDLVLIINAHSIYKKDYIKKCVDASIKYDVENVVGVLRTVPREDSIISKIIALALSTTFGVGYSKYRAGSVKEPVFVDTGAYGCYKRSVFKEIGLFNENLVRSQDSEFNFRLRKSGGKILLIPDAEVYYYSRTDFLDFFITSVRNGFWVVYPLKFINYIPFGLRHIIPFLFVLLLFLSLFLSFSFTYFTELFLMITLLYFLINMYHSFRIAFQEKRLRYLFLMPVIFCSLHIGYGLGSLLGIFELIPSKEFWIHFFAVFKEFQSSKKNIININDLFGVPKPKSVEVNQFPLISIIIPCFNEKIFLPQCLDSLVNQTYQKSKMEILIVDGMSNDGTTDIIEAYLKKYDFIKKLENKNRFTPYAMNMGIRNSNGEFVIKADAHTIYDKNYVKNCIRYIKEYEVDNIGGILKTVSIDDSLISSAIISSLSSFFGVGNSYFRIGSLKPRWVDTVAFGCYHKQTFKKIGMYDEKLIRGQDIELNMRLKKAGGKILLHPDIVGYYYPPSKLNRFMKQSFINGLWAILPFKYTNVLPVSFRHLVPLIFIGLILSLCCLGFFSQVGASGLFLLLGLYAIVDIFFSVRIAHAEKRMVMTWPLSIVFSILHFGYGFGSLIGIIRCLPSRMFWKNLSAIFAKGR
jgi:glycosyltransferase involved in cell wall biosynthesis